MTRVGRGTIVNTNLLRDTITIVNDQQGRKRFGIALDENGNAVVEWFASDRRTLKRLSIP
jgi:alpha-L-arabinofuranosidase